MWHAFMKKPPTQPFTGFLDLPMGDRDGSQSIFTTDENGTAKFEVRFKTCLQMTARQTAALLAIAYHGDGKNVVNMKDLFHISLKEGFLSKHTTPLGSPIRRTISIREIM